MNYKLSKLSVLVMLGMFISAAVFGGHASHNQWRVSEYRNDEVLALEQLQTASLYELSQYEDSRQFISEIIEPENQFHALAFSLETDIPENTNIELELRTYDGKTWTDYEELHPDEHGVDADGLSHYFQPVSLSSAYQYRLELSTNDLTVSPKVESISVTAIDGTNRSNSSGLFSEIVSSLNPYPTLDGLKIISREEWGVDDSLGVYKEGETVPEADLITVEDDYYQTYADELKITNTVNYDLSGRQYTWPITYPESMKIAIVHHTASYHEDQDQAAAVNEIYYYHTKVRGWGDIGYNFLIDRDGNIYEGRNSSRKYLNIGKPLPIGAHAGKFNNGAAGIALILDGDQAEPSLEAMESLMSLIDLYFEKYNIDPTTQVSMRGKTLDRIVGHRDVMATACPGEKFYKLIPEIKTLIKEGLSPIQSTSSSYSFEENSERTTVSMKAQSTGSLQIKLLNKGAQTWNKNTYLLVTKDQLDETKIYFQNGGTGGLPKYYMFEDSVGPGQIATFNIDFGSKVKSGFANFEAKIVYNGLTFSEQKIFLPFYISKSKLSYKVLDYKFPSSVLPGDQMNLSIKLLNDGDLTWNLDQYSKLSIASASVAKTYIVDQVKPNDYIDVSIPWQVPLNMTQLQENINFYLDTELMTGQELSLNLSVFASGVQKSSVDLIEKPTKFYFSPSEEMRVNMTFKNNSQTTLYPFDDKQKFSFRLIKKPAVEISRFTIFDTTIVPGEEFKVTFMLKVPKETGDYVLYLSPQIGTSRIDQELIAYRFSVIDLSTQATIEPDIRVHLTSADLDSYQVTSGKSFSLYIGNSSYEKFSAGDSINLKQEGKLIELKLPNGEMMQTADRVRLIPDSGGIMQIVNLAHYPAWDTSKSWNDNQYRGVLEYQIYNDDLIVINELKLESYLAGLGEVSNGDNPEKIKTINVAARTYAIYYLTRDSKFPDAPYDLNDDPAVSQRYLGYGLELRSPNLVKQVKATAGELVTYDGLVVKTPYFNSTDGTYTKSAKEVWGWDNTPYLISVDDSVCQAKSFSGHGVGLSGCGASAMAENGYSYEEILKYYYTGIDLKKIY